MKYIWNDKEYKCPIEVTLDMIGGKWRSLILWHISKETLRFGELQNIVAGISKKVLTEHLKELERLKLIDRVVYPEVPPRVEYSITVKGKDVSNILDTMEKLGRDILDNEGVRV